MIKPRRIDNEWITYKEYVPREYSQKEIETVWSTYLYRKMGLTFEQIKALNAGENVYTRDSLANLIEKYEKEVEELQVIIDFIKYVKGIGFIPNPPNSLMGSLNFKNYLTDFINHLDQDRKLKKVLEVVDYVSAVDFTEEISEVDLVKMESLMCDTNLDISQEEMDHYAKAFLSVAEKTNLNPSCDEVQEIILYMYNYQKKINNDCDLSAWDFAMNQIILFSYDSDYSAFYKKILGEGGFDFYNNALIEFLYIQEPQRLREYIRTSK